MENNSKMTSTNFFSFSTLAQTIFETPSKEDKIALVTRFFSKLESDEDVRLTAQFLYGNAFSTISKKRASIATATLAKQAAVFCDIDYEMVFKPSRAAVGNTSETIQKLFENLPEARAKWSTRNLDLSEIEAIYKELAHTRIRSRKNEILHTTWSILTPLESKFFLRILGGRSLHIDLDINSLLKGISIAFGQSFEAVRYAYMLTGDLGKTACLAKKGVLDQATFQLFHPVPYMLISPSEFPEEKDLGLYMAEEKLDGMRSQVHISGQQVELYSRDLKNISQLFPEVVDFFQKRNLPDIVLDGALCVFKNNTILSSHLLQKRMAKKKTSHKLITEIPVLFISNDLLFLENTPLFKKTLTERRRQLEILSRSFHLPITINSDINTRSDIEVLLERALAHGNEAITLKRKDSIYEYGKPGNSWLQVKKTNHSLRAILLYAHTSNRIQGGIYADFTFGISVLEDEQYEEEFIPIGKIINGFSLKEQTLINKKVKDLTQERFGTTLLLKPEIVVELAFDHIQINNRTKAKLSLHSPKIKVIRWDLEPNDATTLTDIERLYQHNRTQERESLHVRPSFEWGIKK